MVSWHQVDLILRKVLNPTYKCFFLVRIPLQQLAGLDTDAVKNLIERECKGYEELLHYSCENNELVMRFAKYE